MLHVRKRSPDVSTLPRSSRVRPLQQFAQAMDGAILYSASMVFSPSGRFAPAPSSPECGAVVSTTDPPDDPLYGEPVDCVCTRPAGHDGPHVDEWHDVQWAAGSPPRRYLPGSAFDVLSPFAGARGRCVS